MVTLLVVAAAVVVGRSGPAALASSPARTSARPVGVIRPAVTGTPLRGQLLRAAPGVWFPTPTSFRYRWLRSRDGGRSWTPIPHARRSVYLLVRADEGGRISVRVTAFVAGHHTAAISRATASVRPSPPRNRSAPVVGGTPRRGYTLTLATLGLWSGAGNRVSYRWQRNRAAGWQTIPRARRSVYTLDESDKGARVRVLVTASNVDGSLSVSSHPTSRVQPGPPVNLAPPAVTGRMVPPGVAWARAGSWVPGGSRFAYRWQRSADGRVWRDLGGALHRRHRVTAADTGLLLRVIVRARNLDGEEQATSPAAGVPPASVSRPLTPSGTLVSNYTLAADGGTWTPAAATLSYSWVRCSAEATSITTACTPVGAGPTYHLAAADAGYRMAVRVTASALGGNTSADSPLSEPIASALLSPGGVVRAVPQSFLGISTETDEFDKFVQNVPSFPALLRQLAVPGDNGPVPLRIGGESADGTYLNADGFSAPSGVKSVKIDLAYLQRLGALARALPLKVTLDLNLAAHNPQMAAALAGEAQKALPAGSLDALEIGNEPDLYGWLVGWNWNPADKTWAATYGPQNYASDFASYAAAVSAATPGVPLAGPVLANLGSSWYQTLLQSDGASVGLLTGHRYPFSACATPGTPTYPTIPGQLSSRASSGLANTLGPMVTAAHQAGLKFRLTELGSASCTGLSGVSDTFATALWAPDVLFNMLAVGADGVNVHTRYNTANTPLDGPGTTIVRPFFYGMVLFARTLGPGAALLQSNVSGQLPAGLSVWPVAVNGAQTHVLLINKALSAATVALQAGVQGPAQVQSLRSSSMAPGAQVTFAGQQLSNSGTWQGTPVSSTLHPRAGIFQVTVPALSAALLTYNAG